MPLSDIETIVIVIMENRSFDQMAGYLSLPTTPSPLPVEGLQADTAWLDPRANAFAGTIYPIHPLAAGQQQIDDPSHDHNSIRIQIETPPIGGAPNRMGGFVQSYVQFSGAVHDPSLVMGYYDQTAVPIFDFFARNFVICDHWFAALPTGTQANRLMAMSGETSLVDNARILLPDQQLVYDWLDQHQVGWCVYQSGDFLPFFALMARWTPEIVTSLSLSTVGGRGRFRRYSRFREHWTGAATMPPVIFIEPEYTDGPHADPNDDHPPTGEAKGQAFLSDIYDVLISNPARWQRTAMIVTYDEHGGFFDHVAPLPIPTNAAGFQFTTSGVRVPAFVISPLVAPGRVFNGNLDHTSILQLLADRCNPGQAYSAAVSARQPFLTRLSGVFGDAAPTPPAPTPDPAVVGAIQTIAAAAPVPPSNGDRLGDPPNAQAFHNLALKIAGEHADLLAGPGWDGLADYVKPYT